MKNGTGIYRRETLSHCKNQFDDKNIFVRKKKYLQPCVALGQLLLLFCQLSHLMAARMAMMKTRMKIGQHGSLSSFVDINWLSLMIYADNQDTDIGLRLRFLTRHFSFKKLSPLRNNDIFIRLSSKPLLKVPQLYRSTPRFCK